MASSLSLDPTFYGNHLDLDEVGRMASMVASFGGLCHSHSHLSGDPHDEAECKAFHCLVEVLSASMNPLQAVTASVAFEAAALASDAETIELMMTETCNHEQLFRCLVRGLRLFSVLFANEASMDAEEVTDLLVFAAERHIDIYMPGGQLPRPNEIQETQNVANSAMQSVIAIINTLPVCRRLADAYARECEKNLTEA